MELTVDRLTKQFKNKIAVDRVSLTLRPGVCGLLGANGAGKTTFMRMLCGVLKPTSGTVTFQGQDVSTEEYRKNLGYLPQDFGYYPEFTGRDFLIYLSVLKGMDKRSARNRSQELLETVGLEEKGKKKIKTYSGGMKQRLGIADVLMKDPQIIIMDEPTLGIDPEGMRELLALIRQLSEEDQRTILISSHQLHQVQQICDRVGIFVKGKLIACGSVGELAVQLQSEGNYILELEAYPHDDRLENLLHTVEGVKKITKENEMILVHSDRDCHNDVIVTLLMNGYDLRRLRQRGGDLDEIYSKYFEKAGETYDSDTGKRKGFRDNFRSLVRHASGKGK